MSIMMEVFWRSRSMGRCDEKCYKAKGKTCHCVCRGHLHGLGRNAAVRKLRQLKPYFRGQYEELQKGKIKFF